MSEELVKKYCNYQKEKKKKKVKKESLIFNCKLI